MDIIIFAAVAFYIFFKLNKQLGKIDEEEKKNIESKLANLKIIDGNKSSKKEKIIGFKTTKSNEKPKNLFEDSQVKNLDDYSKSTLNKIFSKCNIDGHFFIGGAKIAFETILKSFAEDNLENVKNLITPKIYEGFKDVNQKRKSQNKTLTTNIISFDQIEIISALISDNNASIAVKFVSQQINYVTDVENNIVAGSKDEINIVEDIWTFKKDLDSPNPNWIVCATSHS